MSSIAESPANNKTDRKRKSTDMIGEEGERNEEMEQPLPRGWEKRMSRSSGSLKN